MGNQGHSGSEDEVGNLICWCIVHETKRETELSSVSS